MLLKVLISFLAILVIQKSFALDGVVTVLEAPIFNKKDLNSPVAQYARKGEVLWISNNPESEGFLETIDRKGNISYIPREYVFIYWNDKREEDEKQISKDNTDYRIEEPLPKNYPFKNVEGYRSNFLLGLATPAANQYDYSQKIKKKNFLPQYDFSMSIFKKSKTKVEDKFFVGGTLNINSYNNSFELENSRAGENFFRIGLGPTLSYDAYIREKYRLSLQTSILLYPYEQSIITDKGETEDFTASKGMAGRVSALYQKNQLLDELDGVVGLGFQIDAPHTLTSNQNSYKREMSYSLLMYFGIQSTY
jgi:hypothetical protein